ncbi:MAG: FAD-binding oxidoreductase [Anaerolineae bacterium]|jgi:FAD/FMN-containing dehydrogenase
MLKFKTISGSNGKGVTLDESQLAEFSQQIRGDLIYADDKAYEEARAIWNGMIDKSPAAILRCAGTADVVKAVKFAGEHDLLLSVRGGGHNVAGHALCDGCLTIDLSQMKGIHVDPHTQTARVQPGVNLGDLDRETQIFGLATPTGIVSETGLAGLTLGGGFGWLTRKHGFTADNLLSADVVTADGRVLRASQDENPDLFWGIRGGGGNFGIVTSFEYQLHPVGPDVLAGLVVHRMEDAADVLRFYRDFAAEAPQELGSMAVFRLAPPAPFIPEALRGQPIMALILFYAGDVKKGEDVVRPLREFGQPLADLVNVKSYIAHQTALDQGQPEGYQYYWKSEYLSQLDDEVIETAVAYSAEMTSSQTRVAIFQLGGAASQVDEMATATGHREAEYILAINNGWENPADNEQQIQWTRDFWREVQQFSTGGAYVNFMSADEGQERVKAGYGAEKYERLVEVKSRYDPNNFFRINQNVKPNGGIE